MAAWILDEAGFVTGTFDGYGPPAGSINIPPPIGAAYPPRFIGGAWVLAGPPSWDVASPEYWWIHVGSFFDRFGAKAYSITSSTDPDVAGLVTLVLPRQYVDLKREDLPSLLDVLVAKGLITEADKLAVLTTPTTEAERYVTGLPQPLESA